MKNKPITSMIYNKPKTIHRHTELKRFISHIGHLSINSGKKIDIFMWILKYISYIFCNRPYLLQVRIPTNRATHYYNLFRNTAKKCLSHDSSVITSNRLKQGDSSI